MSKLLINFAVKSTELVAKTAKTIRPIKETSSALRGKILKDTIELSSHTPIKMSENLIKRTTPEQRTILENLYRYFVEISKKEVKHHPTDIIPKGALLHSQRYNPESLKATLKEGLISGDIGKVLRESNGEQRTIGGLDTWYSDKTRTIKEYFHDWLSRAPEHAHTKLSYMREWGWRGENKWMDLAKGGKKQSNISYVINPNKHPELQPILQHKVTPKTKDLPGTTMGGEMTNGMYTTPDFERHNFIPIGIPANFISKIVVGDKIKPQEIIEIKQIIKESGLDLKIYDTLGNLL